MTLLIGGTRAAGDAADNTNFFRHQLIPFIPFRYFLHQAERMPIRRAG